MTTKKISARSTAADVQSYIGEFGELFYDPNSTILRISDGRTLGGNAVTNDVSGSILTGIFTQASAQIALGLGSLATQSNLAVNIDGGTIDGVVIGGVTPPSGNFTTLSASGFQIGSVQVLALYGGNNSTLAVGRNAALASAGSTGTFSTYVGDGAGNATIPSAGENTYLGSLAGTYSITGALNTYVGCVAGRVEQSGLNTIVGCDAARDLVSLGSNTAVGQNSQRSGGGANNTSIGEGSLQGNSSAIIITGTPTTGDVVTLIFNAPASTVYGSAAVVNLPVSVTVTAGMTMAQLITAMVAAINANATLAISFAGLQAYGIGAISNQIRLSFAGTSTTGSLCVITSTVSGAATEIITINGGFTGLSNVAVGENAMLANIGTTASNNVAVGATALYSIVNGGFNTSLGYQSGYNLISGQLNSIVGYQSGYNATTITGSTLIGYQSGLALTTGFNATMIGAKTGQTTASNVNNVILIGSGNTNVDNPGPGTGHYINIENILISSGTGTPTTSLTSVGGIFAIGGQTGPSWSSGTGVPATTTPTGSLYSNTSGGLYLSSGSGTWNKLSLGSLLDGIFTQAAANTALGIGSLASQANTAVNIDGGTIDGTVIGGVTPAIINATSVNSVTGQFKFNGNNGFAIYGTPGANTTIAIGSNAGTAQSTTIGGFNTFVGDSSGQFTQPGSGENTYIGNLSGVYSTTGHQNAYLGCGAGWFEQSSYNVAIGSDCYRNVVSLNGVSGANTAVGMNSQRNGSGYENTSIGMGSMSSSAASILLSGTCTTGDVVTLKFNAPASSLYGFAALVNVPISVTVTAGMTLTQLTTALMNAINVTIPTLMTTGTQAAGGINTTSLSMTFAGTQTTGCQCVITANVSGAATEIVTINPGFTGYGNIAVGFQAMQGLNMQTANSNVAVGFNALSGLTTGSSNIAILTQAGQNITTGSSNILIGSNTGLAMTTNQYNIAIGISALNLQGPSGYGHTAVGSFSQTNFNATSGGNTSLGYGALQGTVGATGFSNVAVGFQACNLVSTANGITAIGATSGAAVTTGSGNTYIGSASGKSNVSGNFQTFVGGNAGALATANDNTGVGYDALCALTTGYYNVALGDLVGTKLTTGLANLLLGSNVANTTLTTGSNNILIGVDGSTDTPLSSTSNVIIIKGSTGGTAVISSTATNTANPQTVLGGNVWAATSIGTGGLTGPSWSSGAGVPVTTTPAGSLYSNTSGTTGARLYVSAGAGTWNAVAGV